MLKQQTKKMSTEIIITVVTLKCNITTINNVFKTI